MYKLKQNWTLVVKIIFVGYDKQSPPYLMYFPETTAIKRLRCVRFTNSYDNCSLSKPDKNTEFPEYLITYDVQRNDNLNTKGEGRSAVIQSNRGKNLIF